MSFIGHSSYARGVAHGWSVVCDAWGWSWSAYGPNGGETSRALTREEAERRAQAAELRLCGGVLPVDTPEGSRQP